MESDTWKSPKRSWCVWDAQERQHQTQMLSKNLAGDLLSERFVPLCWLHTLFQCKAIQNAAHLNFLLNLVFWECPFPALWEWRGFLDPQSPGYSAIGTATTHSTQHVPHPPGKHSAPRLYFHGSDGKQWFFWVALFRDHAGSAVWSVLTARSTGCVPSPSW